MARARRVWSPMHFHHVTSRGNWRENLFRADRDFYYYLKILSILHNKMGIEIASYCLMSNHYHLLIRSKDSNLSLIMAKLNKTYADYYNYQYKVSGHLFEKRFFSKPIYDEIGIAEVSRYIHLNPLEAKIVSNPQDYKWSSFHYLYHDQPIFPSYLFFDPLLDLFPGKCLHQRKKQYCSWIKLRLNN